MACAFLSRLNEIMLADLAYIYKSHIRGAMPHLLQYFFDVYHTRYDTTIGVIVKAEIPAEPSSNGSPQPEKCGSRVRD